MSETNSGPAAPETAGIPATPERLVPERLVPEPLAPERLVGGQYRLLREIGRGGMGVVWLAEDELLTRQVAVKELRPPPGLADKSLARLRERALREARSAARIRHPNAVALYNVIPPTGADEAAYLIMEFVDGPTLAEVIARNGPMPAPWVQSIGVQLLDVLQAAHALGIVHRDVKPGNILLTQDGQAKLTDFGIAYSVGELRLTTDGIVGTRAYLAPELFHPGPIRPAADLWSLGATLFHAADGRSPFERESTGATLCAILFDPLPTPDCDAGIAAAVSIMLRRDPAERATVEQARDRLLGHGTAPAPLPVPAPWPNPASFAAPPAAVAEPGLSPAPSTASPKPEPFPASPGPGPLPTATPEPGPLPTASPEPGPLPAPPAPGPEPGPLPDPFAAGFRLGPVYALPAVDPKFGLLPEPPAVGPKPSPAPAPGLQPEPLPAPSAPGPKPDRSPAPPTMGPSPASTSALTTLTSPGAAPRLVFQSQLPPPATPAVAPAARQPPRRRRFGRRELAAAVAGLLAAGGAAAALIATRPPAVSALGPGPGPTALGSLVGSRSPGSATGPGSLRAGSSGSPGSGSPGSGSSGTASSGSVGASGSGLSSSASSSTSGSASSGPPPAPLDLTVSTNDADVIDLSWTAPAPGLYYYVNWEDTSAADPAWTSDLHTVTTAALPGLPVGHKIAIYVTAINAAKQIGPPTPTQDVVPREPVPGAPQGLTAVSGNAEVSLSWDPVQVPGIGVWYLIYYRNVTTEGANGAWSSYACPGTTSSPCPDANTTFQATFLTNGDHYQWYVAATDGAGTGAPSDIVDGYPATT
jgi:serine/threonine protein kinase